MNLVLTSAESIAFGRFRVLPRRRELLADDKPIRIGGRAFDLLMVLIEAPGAVVSKDDLLARVWPDRVVTETNLQTQILALRQAFGAQRDLIRTVAGRGYQFTGEIHFVSPDPDKRVTEGLPVAAEDAVAVQTNLPQPVSELIGRDAEVEDVSNLVHADRLVTLTGVGGIGKTRLALAVARRLLLRFPDGVWLAEFSPLSDPGLVPATVAAAIGLELGGGEASVQRVAQALAARRLLVVLDTCEHVIDAAAAMAEAVLRAGSAAFIIATSREPLRAEGEQLYPVPPLAVPPEDAQDLLEYGAVRLFVERARATEPGSVLDVHRATTIAAICRRLDGIPLAIEMAAARVAALGVEGLAGRLDDRLRLLTGGRRMALPRHQTLRATLDWSHELLAEPERVLLRRLAVFAGAFSLEAVGAVVAGDETAVPEVVDGISSMVAKSLVVAEVDATHPRYRLLDTTRAYALEKLAESGERERLARRHAEYYRDLFERSEAELEMRPTAEWLGDYGRQIDNLRTALGWAFSPVGDVEIGVPLTVAAVPLWFQLSLIDECRGRVERALAVLAGSTHVELQRMKLFAALGWSLMYTIGPARETGPAWANALEIANELDDTDYKLRAIWGLWAGCQNNGEFRAALAYAEKFRNIAADSPHLSDISVGDRMMGAALHFLGDQTASRQHIERMLGKYVSPDRRSDIVRFQFDQRVTARITLARVLWLQGSVDQAMREVENNIESAISINHTLSLCNALAQGACPIALLVGDLAAAERFNSLLLHHTEGSSLGVWRAYSHCFNGQLLIKRGDLASGLTLCRAAVGELRKDRFVQYLTAFLGAMAEGLAIAGEISEGLAAIDEALDRCERYEERWCVAELLRIKGELLLLQGAPGLAADAEHHFRRSLDWARRQGSMSWELRAATSFARLLRDQGQPADAMALLQPVYDRFTEGFETADLKAARALLHDLR
jgi:predicted ATPase/DNA-binding winged helix-turn-helix (wHTH) protein